MSELKTLKDIEENQDEAGSDCGVDKLTLQEEAIKWIKEHQTGKSKDLPYLQRFAIIRWIKYFFNITDEDLK